MSQVMLLSLSGPITDAHISRTTHAHRHSKSSCRVGQGTRQHERPCQYTHIRIDIYRGGRHVSDHSTRTARALVLRARGRRLGPLLTYRLNSVLFWFSLLTYITHPSLCYSTSRTWQNVLSSSDLAISSVCCGDCDYDCDCDFDGVLL
jgi:hypothetical protein